MNKITVIDARMGRGKSSAAIRYMNRYKSTKRFLYITPYLNEVSRICDSCDFDQPDSDHMSKSADLKLRLRMGRNVAATHSLFYLMDKEAVQLIKEKGYSLIIDESIQVVERLNVTNKDFELIVTQLADVDDNGMVSWKDPRVRWPVLRLQGYGQHRVATPERRRPAEHPEPRPAPGVR